ncbi:MAG: bifunctional folylpolyglutamate synthase/dihydrofolate synthase [Gammaproteobacteria bacterium]|nr:bifunctional folylpolyglutamate synthase/dihydrofolate synthase [Gammaproteobacteria bacterium]
MFPTLDNWFAHIQQIHHKRMDFGLDRIGIIADRLSLKTFSCPVITVAGTNGKGSCVKTLESIYFEAGFKTALYTSPHLMDFIVSFFEFITLAALYLFQQEKCDVVILEAGLGGRLDAVNIVENDLAVITSIAFDHMDYLGNTLELIAYEKASIARAGKILICGEENPPATIAETVAEKKATLIQINRDFFYTQTCDGLNSKSIEARVQTTAKLELISANKTKHDVLHITLPQPHLKLQNITTAIQVVSSLKNKLPITEKNIIDGIKNTVWPGRFEIINQPIPCVLDVAHNPHAAAWLATQVQQLPKVKNTFAIVGMLKDKAMIETVSKLLPCVNTWYVCSLLSESSERGSDGSEIAAFLKSLGVRNCYTFDSIADGMNSLLHADCQRALIFGSFYTVAAAKRWCAL